MLSQFPPVQLNITVTTITSWDDDLILVPEPAHENPTLGQPGEKIGDILFKETGAYGKHTTQRELLVSLGPNKKLNTAAIRKAGEKSARWLRDHQVLVAGVRIGDLEKLNIQQATSAFCEGLLLGAFQFDNYKSGSNEHKPIQIHILTQGQDPTLEDEIRRVSAILAGVNLAQAWSHEPPNIINPETLARRAESLAAQTGLGCTIFAEKELSEMGAGAILSVGLGSKTPSHMIVLTHPGHGAGAEAPPIVVVGKAITFDTGGYSLKTKTGIVGMKYDKCGGMAVLGIMQAVAALNLPIPVVGIVAAAENMISKGAYRPNDIITTMSGKTIEIISTDAEGRMVLSDALTYAHTHYKPRAIIDLATLTGGVVVAIGKIRAGLMSNNDTLAEALFAAGERTHERLWRLPLDEDYFELIKGGDSDIRNSAGIPQASPVVGGMFLKQFVPDDVPWAHIDIAGTATIDKTAEHPKQATGFGVRLVLEYLQSQIKADLQDLA